MDALRRAGFMVTEAWPLDTEMKFRLRGMDSAALASSNFLVTRKREEEKRQRTAAVQELPPTASAPENAERFGVRRLAGALAEAAGQFEAVRAELEQIVRERVETLWDMGISGADLVIACVGAGLRAFTRFGRVAYANGEEVSAERFLTEVETVVLETVLEKLSQMAAHGTRPVGPIGPTPGLSLSGPDAPTRFYVCGATPTGRRNWKLARPSSLPTARTWSWTARPAWPRAPTPSCRRSKTGIGCVSSPSGAGTSGWGLGTRRRGRRRR